MESLKDTLRRMGLNPEGQGAWRGYIGLDDSDPLKEQKIRAVESVTMVQHPKKRGTGPGVMTPEQLAAYYDAMPDDAPRGYWDSLGGRSAGVDHEALMVAAGVPRNAVRAVLSRVPSEALAAYVDGVKAGRSEDYSALESADAYWACGQIDGAMYVYLPEWLNRLGACQKYGPESAGALISKLETARFVAFDGTGRADPSEFRVSQLKQAMETRHHYGRSTLWVAEEPQTEGARRLNGLL